MELTNYQKRNFLTAVRDGRVTQFDMTTLMVWSDGNSEDVQPLMDWALDAELVDCDWHPRNSGDSNVAELTEAGMQMLGKI